MRLVLALAALLGLAAPAGAQPNVLRAVLNLELQVLDPIITTSNVTRAYAYLVYDTLVALDSKGEYRPQMLEGWEVSADRLTWTFKLREGLEWHDGQPVTAEDCVESLRRWGARDGLGSRLMAASKGLRVVDARSFVLELNWPFSQVIEAIGKPAAQIPFMMPARLARSTPVTQAVPETIGSGPYSFNRAEWRSGSLAIFRRNPRYVPRAEPADGFAGGKRAHMEQVHFISMPDIATRISAMTAGEADYLELVPGDFIESFRRNRNIRLIEPPPLGSMIGAIAINHQHPPFNNPQARRAFQLAIDHNEVVAALGLPRQMTYGFCASIFMCGWPYASEAAVAPLRVATIEQARAALRASGYNNEPLVLLHSMDSTILNPTSLVVAERARLAGFNVQVSSADFSTQAQRRNNTEPVERGGWSAMPVVFTGYDMVNPIANYSVAYNCGNNYPGRYCDPGLTPVIEAFEREADPAKRRELAAQMQQHVHEAGLMGFYGQFYLPAAHRAEVTGVLPIGFPVLYNIQRVR